MTTDLDKSTQLSNKRQQVLKPEYNLSLIGNYRLIYRKEDGFVNVTDLCKAGNKRFNDWKRLNKTTAFLQVLCNDTGIPVPLLLKLEKGYAGDQGTWAHPQVCVNIAQWVSPEFDVQVSKWVFELALTGTVTLGQEKSNKELEEAFQQRLDNLQQTVETVVNENIALKLTHQHLAKLHDDLRMKRNYHKFKKGNCLYIVTDRWREKNYLKIGYTDDINARLRTYRTSMPDCKIEFLIYLTENKILEKCIKLRYNKSLIQKNHEYVIDTSVEKLTTSVKSLVKYLNIEATEETTLALYNQPYKTYNLVFLDQDGNIEKVDEPKTMKIQNVENDGKTCPVCKKIFRDKGKLNRHVRSVHEKSTKVKCKECGKLFSSRDAMNYHVNNIHKKIGQRKCVQCDKICSNAGNLKKHISKMHDKTTGVTCNICEKKFSNSCNLTQHILIVHERKEICNCDICGKELKSVKGLEYHLRHLHGI
jgi:hypothetical protein